LASEKQEDVMDQNIGSEGPVDPAAVAFEALRREVALLKVAVAGLAAERAPAPDYSETLGEIAKGVSVAIGRLGKVMASPALALSPAEMALRIAAASEEARRQDRAALRQAQEGLTRTAGDLRGWIDGARQAGLQNRRLVQAAAVGALGGIIIGTIVPTLIADAAPAPWAWPEKRAARILHRDLRSAGERMLVVATAQPLAGERQASTAGGDPPSRGPRAAGGGRRSTAR
jgi:hypothetical protein